MPHLALGETTSESLDKLYTIILPLLLAKLRDWRLQLGGIALPPIQNLLHEALVEGRITFGTSLAYTLTTGFLLSFFLFYKNPQHHALCKYSD